MDFPVPPATLRTAVPPTSRKSFPWKFDTGILIHHVHVVRFNFDTSVSHGLGACIIREANCMQQFACNLLLDTATGRHGQGDVECPADNQSLDIANRVPKQHCATIMPVSIWPRSRPSYTTARPPRRAAARPIPTAQSLAAAQSPAAASELQRFSSSDKSCRPSPGERIDQIVQDNRRRSAQQGTLGPRRRASS